MWAGSRNSQLCLRFIGSLRGPAVCFSYTLFYAVLIFFILSFAGPHE